MLTEASGLFGNLRKFLENFGHNSKVIFRCFYDILKFTENLRKSSEVFRNFRKFSENFGNGSKVIFRCFYDFLIFLKNAPWIYAPGYKSPDISPQDISPRFLAFGYNPPDIGPGYNLLDKKL